jgi:hypothetical protein
MSLFTRNLSATLLKDLYLFILALFLVCPQSLKYKVVSKKQESIIYNRNICSSLYPQTDHFHPVCTEID